jgi:hypothetical protein
MSTNTRLCYLWCVLTSGLFFISVLPGGSWTYKALSIYDSNRWLHFLACATVAAIPVAAWRLRTNLLLSLVIGSLGIVPELLQQVLPGAISRPRNILADLFGVAAGVLLGLNIRVMHNSARSPNNVSANPSRSTML